MKQRRPDLYPSETCLSCSRSNESQAHFWTCPNHLQKWSDTLDRATDMLMLIFQQLTTRTLSTLTTVAHHIHESRTFISRGIISNSFYDFIYKIDRSLSNTNIIIAKVYNYIYHQVFTHIWKSRCALVIAYEQSIGITHQSKHTKVRFTCFNFSSNSQIQPAHLTSEASSFPPWVAWITASIRHDANWLSHVFTPQADMYRSFITSALNSLSNHINPKLPNRIIDSLDPVYKYLVV